MPTWSWPEFIARARVEKFSRNVLAAGTDGKTRSSRWSGKPKGVKSERDFTPFLSLDDDQRTQPGDLASNASGMDRFHHLVDILIRSRRFLCQTRQRSSFDDDAAGFQFTSQPVAADFAFRLRAAHHPPGAVTGGAPGALHAVGGANQHPGGGAHAARHQHRLSNGTVNIRQFRGAGTKGTRSTFAVHAHLDALPIHLKGLDLAHVVGDIIYLVKLPILYLTCQSLFKSIPGRVGQQLAIAEGVIGRSAHGCQIIPPFRAVERRTHQLAVWQRNAVTMHCALHVVDIISTNLVAKAARTAMDLQGQTTFLQSHGLGSGQVKDLVDDIHLNKVVASSQCAQLTQAPFFGLRTDFSWIRAVP